MCGLWVKLPSSGVYHLAAPRAITFVLQHNCWISYDIIFQVVRVIWHNALSASHSDHLIILARWRQCASLSNAWFIDPTHVCLGWDRDRFIRFCRAYTDRGTHTHTHTFNGPLSGTTRVSRYQKGKTNLDFAEARDSEWQWHQLGHMQVCTSLQTDNHASTPPLSFLQAGCPSCHPTNSVKALKANIQL